MQDLNNKINDGGATADGVLPAEQWNEVATEAQNLITSSGQTLSGADLQQIAKAVAHYSANGNNYTVGGTANAITLSAVGSMIAPSAYSDGMEVRFEAASSNTGATTINVNGIGVVSLLTESLGSLPVGYVVANQRYSAVYRNSSSAFVLSTPSAWKLAGEYTVSGAVASFEFTGIASSARFVRVSISDLSPSGTDDMMIQLGAGSYITSGYVGRVIEIGSSGVAWSSGAVFFRGGSGTTESSTGNIDLIKQGTSNVWTITGKMYDGQSGTTIHVSVGDVDVAAALQKIKFMVNGANNLDAGTVAVWYQ